MFHKNKKVLSLALGLAMVYGVGTMSVYASPNEEIPEKPPIIQEDQDHLKHRKHHKPIQENWENEKPPVAPEPKLDEQKPMYPKKHTEDQKPPMPPQGDFDNNEFSDCDR